MIELGQVPLNTRLNVGLHLLSLSGDHETEAWHLPRKTHYSTDEWVQRKMAWSPEGEMMVPPLLTAEQIEQFEVDRVRELEIKRNERVALHRMQRINRHQQQLRDRENQQKTWLAARERGEPGMGARRARQATVIPYSCR